MLRYVRCRLRRVVQQIHQLSIRSGIADTCVTDAAADVRLDHPVHFRIGYQRDRPVNMFEKGISRELRRANEVGGVELELVQRVVSIHLEYIGQQADVTMEIELHIVFEALTLKVGEYVLGVCVIGL